MNVFYGKEVYFPFPVNSLISGEGWSQYILHLLSILSSPRIDIWCDWIYNINWYLVSWLCPCWASFRPGLCHLFLNSDALSAFIYIFLMWNMLLFYSASISRRKCSWSTCGDYQGLGYSLITFDGSEKKSNTIAMYLF